MWIVVVAVALTLAVVFIVRNASVGERHITKARARYSTDDPQFSAFYERVAWPANRGRQAVETLVNG
jgi:hypothetical protein